MYVCMYVCKEQDNVDCKSFLVLFTFLGSFQHYYWCSHMYSYLGAAQYNQLSSGVPYPPETLPVHPKQLYKALRDQALIWLVSD